MSRCSHQTNYLMASSYTPMGACHYGGSRITHNRQLIRMDKGKYPGVLKTNHDNSSSLLAFSFSEMPDNFVIAKEEQCIAAS